MLLSSGMIIYGETDFGVRLVRSRRIDRRYVRIIVRLTTLSAFLPVLAFYPRGECQTAKSEDQSSASVAGLEPSLALKSRPATPAGPDYNIGPGDVLRISVWDEAQLNTDAVVRPDGKISIPLLPELAVSGMTPEAAQHLVADQLTRFVRHPQVTVIVEEIHSRVVYVTGEVQHPGAYPLISPTNVVQMIARAGGPTESARQKEVYVLRQDDSRKVRVNYRMVLAGKHLEENIGLHPGDTVVVP
jgi:polysaccharide export outer membrane protein